MKQTVWLTQLNCTFHRIFSPPYFTLDSLFSFRKFLSGTYLVFLRILFRLLVYLGKRKFCYSCWFELYLEKNYRLNMILFSNLGTFDVHRKDIMLKKIPSFCCCKPRGCPFYLECLYPEGLDRFEAFRIYNSKNKASFKVALF